MTKATKESSALEDALEQIYRATPDDFTATRKKLAAELKSAGEKEAAAAIATAHKPTVTAWAVNQIAHRHARDLEAFTKAADGLRSAQRDLLEASAAKSAEAKKAFGEARTELNKRIAELQRIAKEELAGIGVEWSLSFQRRITTTLNTAPLAAADDLARVLHGRLVKDLDSVEDDSVLAVALGPIDERKHAARTHEHKATNEREERERKERAEREAKARAKRALEDEARSSERHAEHLEAEAAKAEAIATRARDLAEAAKRKAKKARAAADAFE